MPLNGLIYRGGDFLLCRGGGGGDLPRNEETFEVSNCQGKKTTTPKNNQKKMRLKHSVQKSTYIRLCLCRTCVRVSFFFKVSLFKSQEMYEHILIKGLKANNLKVNQNSRGRSPRNIPGGLVPPPPGSPPVLTYRVVFIGTIRILH